ncbi:MAG: radical SAM protein [Alicyclobacillus sp.]|nr:radical SAM protein [Alicyclobacillus sp.]
MTRLKAPQYEGVQAQTVMNRVADQVMPFDWSINPYRGCTHGCSFCYARNTHTFLGQAADDSFRTQIFVKENAPEALERQLYRLAKRYAYDLDALWNSLGVVQIGTATDPYQPIEAKRRLTRRCLEVLRQFQAPVMVTTRSPLVLRDVDLLVQMNVRAVCVSVHTLDSAVWRGLEPSTPHPHKRLDAVRALRAAGIRAGILLAPVIPYISDGIEQLDEVLCAAQVAGAAFASPSVLRLGPEVRSWFFSVVGQVFPSRLEPLQRMYVRPYAPAWYQDQIRRTVGFLKRRRGWVTSERMESAQVPARTPDPPPGIQLPLQLDVQERW